MLQNENLFLWGCQVTDRVTIPMPGTIGGAKLVFKKENMQNYNVKLIVEYTFDVSAENMDEACDTARHFYKTMKHTWGEHNNNLIWVDSVITKQSAEQEINE